MSKILVFSEQQSLLCEMISKARSLADSGLADSVAAVGWESADTCTNYGADEAYILEALPEDAPIESIVPELCSLAADARLILVGGTKHGREISGRVGARLSLPCVTDISSVEYGDGKLRTKHVVYGGLAVQEDVFDSAAVLTVPSGRFQKVESPRDCTSGSVKASESRVRVVERKAAPKSDVNISEANVVVCVGRGLSKQEDLALIQELADAVGGVIGCTRPISEDFGWLPTDRYIGLSGKVLAPKLHISLGCSGQIQHIAGLRDAKTIVAVDKDDSAPIWDAADYGIIGDLYEVVPALIRGAERTITATEVPLC